MELVDFPSSSAVLWPEDFLVSNILPLGIFGIFCCFVLAMDGAETSAEANTGNKVSRCRRMCIHLTSCRWSYFIFGYGIYDKFLLLKQTEYQQMWGNSLVMEQKERVTTFFSCCYTTKGPWIFFSATRQTKIFTQRRDVMRDAECGDDLIRLRQDLSMTKKWGSREISTESCFRVREQVERPRRIRIGFYDLSESMYREAELDRHFMEKRQEQWTANYTVECSEDYVQAVQKLFWEYISGTDEGTTERQTDHLQLSQNQTRFMQRAYC